MDPVVKEYLFFKRMISPIIIQVFFWIGFVVAIIAGIWSMFTLGFINGLLILVFAPIILRISSEMGILLFRINENLVTIKNSLTKSS